MKTSITDCVLSYLNSLAARGERKVPLAEVECYVKSMEHTIDEQMPANLRSYLGELLGPEGMKLSKGNDGDYVIAEFIRLPGRKTPATELDSWEPKKLRDQILMQIRTDFGGRSDKESVVMKRAGEFGVTLDAKQAQFVINQMEDTTRGSRVRIQDKLNNLCQRAILLDKLRERIQEYKGRFGF